MRSGRAAMMGAALLAAGSGQAAPGPAGDRPILESANIHSVQQPHRQRARHHADPWRGFWLWRLRYDLDGAGRAR